ncbi:MAG: hypothetical protein IJ112_00885 [Oscillospiraceae bacterium]|nr:hypothetical protein [Oscillospiraceae bacterium]
MVLLFSYSQGSREASVQVSGGAAGSEVFLIAETRMHHQMIAPAGSPTAKSLMRSVNDTRASTMNQQRRQQQDRKLLFHGVRAFLSVVLLY